MLSFNLLLKLYRRQLNIEDAVGLEVEYLICGFYSPIKVARRGRFPAACCEIHYCI